LASFYHGSRKATPGMVVGKMLLMPFGVKDSNKAVIDEVAGMITLIFTRVQNTGNRPGASSGFRYP